MPTGVMHVLAGAIMALVGLVAIGQPAALGEPGRNTRDGDTLRSLDPALVGTIGFNNPSYASQLPTTPPPGAVGPARVETFIAPDGRPTTVTIRAPKVEGRYDVQPMAPGEDPAAYFANAVAQAGHRTVVFPKGGIYEFRSACPSGGAYLKFNAPTDVVIDGNGSAFHFRAPCAGISLVHPERVVLKNLTIDWPTLQIASLGSITASRAEGPKRNTYDLKLDRPYVSAGMPLRYKAINSWDVQHGTWSLQHPDHELGYKPEQPLTADGEAHGVQSWGVRFAPGERVLIRHYTTEGDAIDVIHGHDVTLDKVTIYASPGFGVGVLWASSGFAMTNSTITRAPGRLISTAADALHISNAVGDVLVENNTFAYQGDDGLNLNTTTFRVPSSATNDVPLPSDHAYIRPGDPVALFNSEMKLLNGRATIVGVTPDPVEHVNRVSLDRPIPPAARGGFLVDLNYPAARYIVRNNRFLHNRARGALLQTAYGLVDGNVFAGQTMYALYLTVFPPEGPGAQNVLVTHNKISETGVGGGPGAIVLARGAMVYAPAAPPVHQNVIFKDNVITDVPGPAFYISSVNNVILTENTLRDTNAQPLENRWNASGDLNAAIVINDASNIVLLRNTIASDHPVRIDPLTTTGIHTSYGGSSE